MTILGLTLTLIFWKTSGGEKNNVCTERISQIALGELSYIQHSLSPAPSCPREIVTEQMHFCQNISLYTAISACAAVVTHMASFSTEPLPEGFAHCKLPTPLNVEECSCLICDCPANGLQRTNLVGVI